MLSLISSLLSFFLSLTHSFLLSFIFYIAFSIFLLSVFTFILHSFFFYFICLFFTFSFLHIYLPPLSLCLFLSFFFSPLYSFFRFFLPSVDSFSFLLSFSSCYIFSFFSFPFSFSSRFFLTVFFRTPIPPSVNTTVCASANPSRPHSSSLFSSLSFTLYYLRHLFSSYPTLKNTSNQTPPYISHSPMATLLLTKLICTRTTQIIS